MADRAETILKGKNGLNYLRIEFGEVEVTLADTVTLDNFDSGVSLLSQYLLKKSTGAAMSSTNATNNNVILITGAGTNVPCYYIAYGYVA